MVYMFNGINALEEISIGAKGGLEENTQPTHIQAFIRFDIMKYSQIYSQICAAVHGRQ